MTNEPGLEHRAEAVRRFTGRRGYALLLSTDELVVDGGRAVRAVPPEDDRAADHVQRRVRLQVAEGAGDGGWLVNLSSRSLN